MLEEPFLFILIECQKREAECKGVGEVDSETTTQAIYSKGERMEKLRDIVWDYMEEQVVGQGGVEDVEVREGTCESAHPPT